MVFVSAEYAARDWTRLERRAALDRAVHERREYVLPARFDDTPLPRLLSGMVAVDLGTRTPEQFAAMIGAKLTAVGIIGQAGDPVSETGVARPPGAIRVAEADLRRLGVHEYARLGHRRDAFAGVPNGGLSRSGATRSPHLCASSRASGIKFDTIVAWR